MSWLRRAVLILILVPAVANAQFTVRTWLPWRTIETPHFAFHYPRELDAWTQSVALRVEAIDSAVSRLVGYTPARKTHVVVDDPYETPNGSAWPYLNGPVISLWATPPDPRDDIGEFRVWGEMVVSHEFAHIAHLTRPSRNAFTRHLWQALPVDIGPVAMRAPRWAIEGYATYIEGRVTGSGRPHGAWRAAFLRQWALEGQLPHYEQLDSWGAYAGGEFAYLAGSAYLEWLVAHHGDSSLVQVWRRLSAKQTRTFDQAFTGVFGESPRALYGQFTTDLTANALAAQRLIRAAGTDTGAIVQRLSWGTGDPAVSADGQRIVIVLRSPTEASRVVIWGSAPEPDTGKARRDSLLLRADPEDVPARAIYPAPKKVLATLRSNGASYDSPRFLRDGRVLLWKSTPVGNGSFRPDLFLWDPRRHQVRRVTHGASVRDGDPSPDGRTAVAARCHSGWCDLVSVDLNDGAVRVIAAGSPTRSFYRPRIRPGGRDAIVSVHDGASWQLALVTLATGEMRHLATPSGANWYDAAWVNATQVVAVSERGGVANITSVNVDSAETRVLTAVTGAAVAPEPNPRDSSILFLSLYSRGYDLRSVPRGGTTDAAVSLPSELTPAASPPPRPRREFPANGVSAPQPFALTPRLFRWIPQPEFDADGMSLGLGLVSNDMIGRSEVIAKFALGDAAMWRGGALNTNWRGTRPAIHVQFFAAEQRPSESHLPVARPIDLDARLSGATLAVDGTQQYERWASRLRAGGSVGQATMLAAQTPSSAESSAIRALVFADGALAWTQRGALASVTESFGVNATAGQSFSNRFSRGVVTASLSSSGQRAFPLGVSALYGRTNADAPPFEQFALGGGASPIIDRVLLSQRVTMPALPTAMSVNSSVFTYRATLAAAPFVWYWWAGSTAAAGERFTAWQRVAGLEWSEAVGPIAIAGTPAARIQIGVGESLDAPFRHRVRAYLNLVLDP